MNASMTYADGFEQRFAQQPDFLHFLQEVNRHSIEKLKKYDFVICDDHGVPLCPGSYGGIIKRVAAKAGIERLHPHKFRHTFVSILLSNPDIGIAVVAKEADHAQPTTTLAIYTQIYQTRRAAIRDQMSRELFGDRQDDK